MLNYTKTFKTASFQLTETKKWVPSGKLAEQNDEKEIIIKEGDVFPPEYRFDTKEEADNFFREHFINKGYIEEIDK